MDNPPVKKTRVFYGYCRESIDLESGIKIQKEQIIKYAELNNILISKWYIDNDSSAYLYRPNYEIMLKIDLPASEETSGIICSSLSRFGRSLQKVLMDIETLDKQGKQLIAIKENIDRETSQGRLMFGLFTLFNDFEHDLILERTQAGIDHAKRYGTKSGKPMHRPPIKVDWKEFEVLREKGLSVPSIAKMFGITKKTLYNKIKVGNISLKIAG